MYSKRLKQNNMAKAIIKQISHGNLKGQFKFELRGDNGENLSAQEKYTQKHNVLDVLAKYFPNFEVIDQTEKRGKKKVVTEEVKITFEGGE